MSVMKYPLNALYIIFDLSHVEYYIYSLIHFSTIITYPMQMKLLMVHITKAVRHTIEL